MSSPGASRNDHRPTGLPPELEARLFDLIFDRRAPSRAGELEQLCREHHEHASALLCTMRCLLEGQQLAGLLPADQLAVRDDLTRVLDARGGLAVGETLGDDPSIGTVLQGRYRIDSSIGRGGMGAVYRCTDLELQREVAVKLMTALGESAEVRFLREAKALATLNHPHIVDIYDCGRSASRQPFLVMPLVRGHSLGAVLAAHAGFREGAHQADRSLAWLADLFSAPVPQGGFLRLAVGWIADVAAALRVAHAQGLFHRDLKPSNILITDEMVAVLIDFGLVRCDTDEPQTASRAMIGTPAYMAPEQIHGGPVEPELLDVYSLAATLYHVLGHRQPYTGDLAQVATQLARGSLPPRLETLHPRLPRDLRAIVETGMEWQPAQRYPSVAAMEQDLRAFLEFQPVSVRPISYHGRIWRRIRRAPVHTLAAASLLTVGVMVFVVTTVLSEWRQQARLAEKRELLLTLPALLGIEGDPEQRLTAALMPEREGNIELLSRILELDPGDVPTRVLRGALLLDNGDCERSRDDLAEAARRVGSPYMRAVAERFAAAQGRGTKAVDLAGLPEPETPEDCFIAGFHELRNRHLAGFADRAFDLLTRAVDYPPARDLRLLAMIARARNMDQVKEVEHEARFLEGRYDRPSARTRAMIGVSLAAQKRYQDAVEPLEQSLALRPDRHGPLHNLGVAQFHLRRLPEARSSLSRARELRPWFPHTLRHLALVHAQLGETRLALQTAGQIEVLAVRHELEGQIHLEAAFLKLRGDGGAGTVCPEVAEAATAAVASFEAAARERGRSLEIQERLNRQLAIAIRDGASESGCSALANLMAEQPTNDVQLANLAEMLPAGDWGAPMREALRKCMRSLAQELRRMRERPDRSPRDHSNSAR